MIAIYRFDMIDDVILGVTIKMASPGVNVSTAMEDTKPFSDTVADVPAVKTSRQDRICVSWEKPPMDENNDGVCKFLRCTI